MELKRLFGGMALIALAAACSSDDTAIDRPDTTKGAISMQAAINDGTRVSFATAGEDTKGLKVSWQTSDCVTAFAAQGASTGQFAVSNISTDGHSATLTGNLSPEVTAATDVYAYIATSHATKDGTTVTFDWATQSGKMDELGNYDILTAAGSYTPGSSSGISMSFRHSMSFLKATITLPDIVSGSTATVKLKGTGLGNSIEWDGANNTFAPATLGDVTLNSVPLSGTTLTFYAALYPGMVTDLRADVTVGSISYTDLLVTKNALLEAGKLYTVSRNNTELQDLAVWTDDKAWSYTYNVANYKIDMVEKVPDEGSEWLTVTSDGQKVVVSATANTTGAPRQCTLSFTNGSQTTIVDLTQIEESDFAGDWDMTTFKLFTSTGSTALNTYDNKFSTSSTTPPGSYDMTVRDGLDYGNNTELYIENKTGSTATAYEGLTQAKQTATNNLCINGIYENLKTEALARVDHSSLSATVSIFFDLRSATKAQRLYTGPYAGQYAALMPELFDTKNNTPWATAGFIFKYATIGVGDDNQMFWYTGKVEVNGHTTTVRWINNTSGYQTLSTSTNHKVVGLQIDRYTGTTMSAATLIRQGTTTSTNAAWAKVYQGDVVMRRTASGYKEIIGGGAAQ